MKTTLLALTLLTALLQADEGMSWVDQKIEEIKPQRQGLSSRALSRLKNPFVLLKSGTTGKGTATKAPSASTGLRPVKKDMSGAPLTLQAVMNTSALINNKWYKENAKVREYKLTQIKNGYVVLESKKKKLRLFIARKNKNLNISTK